MPVSLPPMVPSDDPQTASIEERIDRPPTSSNDQRKALLLSVDFEDWHQLVRRRIGVAGWEQPGPALRRQTERLLSLLDELGVRATFFVLAMAARSHPELIGQVVAAGHEIGCHGDAHRLVSTQTAKEFAEDLRGARTTIEQLSGRRPVGYRAPAFSITRETPWAYEVLVEEGFSYDASQHDTPRIRHRVVPSTAEPHPLEVRNGTLWEFPVAVWRLGRVRVPVGGASYWAMMPTALVLEGVANAGALAGLYLHPYELDPEPLRAELPQPTSPGQRAQGLLRGAQRNLARIRAGDVLKAIAERHDLIPYGEAHAQLSGSSPARP
jgi:polysaccharide deacetylase family protein (PEP-CTERM system associated)